VIHEEQDENVHRTAISILNYFRTHPSAHDSIPGIAHWWVHEDVKTVEKAVGLLVVEGVIEKTGGAYRLKLNPKVGVEKTDSSK